MYKYFVVPLVILSFSLCSMAREYELPNSNQRLIGEKTVHKVVKGDYFQKIAEQYDVGFLSLLEANEGVDPFLPTVDSELVIPTQMLLPYADRKGIVINLPELRLYYYPANENKVYVFPVGIGREGLETPQLTSYVGQKRKNPTWRPTEEMKVRYLEEDGIVLPDEVPPGPENPFGKYAIRIGTSVYLIHGTNKRMGIGMRASSGCIRMYANDIKWLYENVPLKTQIKIIDQSVKMSYHSSKEKLIEIHRPLTSEANKKGQVEMTDQMRKFASGNVDNLRLVYQEVAKPTGTVITLEADDTALNQ